MRTKNSAVTPYTSVGMQPIWSTEQYDFFTKAKISFVLSSRLAAFQQTCKGSIQRLVTVGIVVESQRT